MKITHRGAMLTLLVCIASLSCRDALTPERSDTSAQSSAAAQTLATLECQVDIRAKEVTCEESKPAPGAARRAILGQNQIKMASSNVLSDTVAEAFSLDVTVQNLLLEPIGTPDGATVSGVKVFFHTGPTATAYKVPGDTSRVTVKNPDGVGNFTAANQPYHLYLQLLQPQQVSAKRRVEFSVPRTVERFSFSVKVFAAIPSAVPVPATAPEDFFSETVREQLYAQENLVIEGTRFPRNLIAIYFRDEASLEERQAAIDAVGGTVVGGLQGTNYLVKIRDDGTSAPLWRAIEMLRALPQVRAATPEVVRLNTNANYLRPYRCRNKAGQDSLLYMENEECRDIGYSQGSPTSRMYGLEPIVGAQPALIDQRSGEYWDQFTFAEDRDEFVFRRSSSPNGSGTCRVEFRRMSAPAQIAFTAPAASCGDGATTFAPARVAGSESTKQRVQPRRTPAARPRPISAYSALQMSLKHGSWPGLF